MAHAPAIRYRLPGLRVCAGRAWSLFKSLRKSLHPTWKCLDTSCTHELSYAARASLGCMAPRAAGGSFALFGPAAARSRVHPRRPRPSPYPPCLTSPTRSGEASHHTLRIPHAGPSHTMLHLLCSTARATLSKACAKEQLTMIKYHMTPLFCASRAVCVFIHVLAGYLRHVHCSHTFTALAPYQLDAARPRIIGNSA